MFCKFVYCMFICLSNFFLSTLLILRVNIKNFRQITVTFHTFFDHAYLFQNGKCGKRISFWETLKHCTEYLHDCNFEEKVYQWLMAIRVKCAM